MYPWRHGEVAHLTWFCHPPFGLKAKALLRLGGGVPEKVPMIEDIPKYPRMVWPAEWGIKLKSSLNAISCDFPLFMDWCLMLNLPSGGGGTKKSTYQGLASNGYHHPRMWRTEPVIFSSKTGSSPWPGADKLWRGEAEQKRCPWCIVEECVWCHESFFLRCIYRIEGVWKFNKNGLMFFFLNFGRAYAFNLFDYWVLTSWNRGIVVADFEGRRKYMIVWFVVFCLLHIQLQRY